MSKDDIIGTLCMFFLFFVTWFLVSIAISGTKQLKDSPDYPNDWSCEHRYPLDYFFATRLLCPIAEDVK